MKLPNGERAIVDIVKLRGYCLSMDHPEGKHKARVFLTALGLSATDSEVLKEALRVAARTNEATATGKDSHGQRFALDFSMTRFNHSAIVRSAAIIRRGEDLPRLTSCYAL